MGRKPPAAPGDDKRARKIDPTQGARVYQQDKAGGPDFYCVTCSGWFPAKALDLHAGH